MALDGSFQEETGLWSSFETDGVHCGRTEGRVQIVVSKF